MACGSPSALQDRFGRRITYVRLSLTDRCDMRCRYCMAEDMTFLPRADILSLEEFARLARGLVARGVTRLRLTGGEPLVRRGVTDLAKDIGAMIGHGLDELTMTTNGARLAVHADALWDAGLRRLNISLDSRDPARFGHVTRVGQLADVLDGIAAAKARGFAIKINMVALNGINHDEIADMLAWCCAEGFDLSLIETMPLGEIGEDRTNRFYPLTTAKAELEQRFQLIPSAHQTGGPARYWAVAGTQSRLGLISPLTQNFCASCNRVRVSASGMLYMCLGHEDHLDLRAAMRSDSPGALDSLLDQAMHQKRERHECDLRRPAPRRQRRCAACAVRCWACC